MEKQKRQNLAIIGSGISGLSAAYMLAPYHNIRVYEKNDYIGGHSRTIEVATPDGNIWVDTGFIVFNFCNYPLLTSLFSYLNVPVVKSHMSFGVSIKNGWLEYGTQNLQNMFAQKSNLLRPRFWGMIADILKFNRNAHIYMESDPSFTLEACLDALGIGSWFREYFLLAMGGAIWSTPVKQMLEFPAQTFIRFFHNHGLLTIKNQPQWYTVEGGSREYIKRLSASFTSHIRLNCSIEKVVRDLEGVTLHHRQGQTERFDHVIFACHADQALALIENPTLEERTILGKLRYQRNRMVLHRDARFLPQRKSAWASWVYVSGGQKEDSLRPISLTYWMNNLQPLATSMPIFVTLNPSMEPKKDLIYEEYWFEHPVFDAAAIQAQTEMEALQGKARFYFCGAYQRYGFHEDGLWSAVKMVERLGIQPGWS